MYVLLHLLLSLSFDTHSWSSNPLWEAFASYAFKSCRVSQERFLPNISEFCNNVSHYRKFFQINLFNNFLLQRYKKFVLIFSWYHWACHANKVSLTVCESPWSLSPGFYLCSSSLSQAAVFLATHQSHGKVVICLRRLWFRLYLHKPKAGPVQDIPIYIKEKNTAY